MSQILQICNNDIIELLARYQLLPQLLQELSTDEAIAPFSCSPDEEISACQEFYQKNQLFSPENRQAWLAYHHISPEQLTALATRKLRIEKFKQATWSHKLESYFLSRKSQLDVVIYSLIRVKDAGLAQELYFRIQEQEQSFAEIARTYSQGPESQTGGIVGPVELSVPHPTLSQLLSKIQPQQLTTPVVVGEWVVIVRLEKLIPAQLDATMRQRLLNELFSTWLREQVQKQTINLDDNKQ